MNLTDLLLQQLGGDTAKTLGQQFGLDESQTQQALQVAIPVLMGAFAKNTATEDGANSLHNALSRDHDGSILSDLAGFILGGGGQEQAQQPQEDIQLQRRNDGAGILGHLLGGNSGNLANIISMLSKMDLSKAIGFLQTIAPLVMGVLGKVQNQNGLDSQQMAGLIQNTQAEQTQNAPDGLTSILSSVLDSDQDGTVMGDIAGMAFKIFGGR